MNDSLAVDRLGLSEFADFRWYREFRRTRRIACDGPDRNQKQKDTIGDAERV
jgi:hypothetical protein